VEIPLAVLDGLVDKASGSPWTYALVFGIALLDAFFPVVPSETLVITAGVLSASGDLNVAVVIACAAAGAICGDNVSYWIGRTLGEPVERRFFKGERHKRLEWAQHQLEERGGYLLVVARFIPGGRTATTFACGLLEWSWRRFLAFDVVAGIVWGTYASLLGYFGGKAFESNPLVALLVAAGVAAAIAGLIEGIRWLRRRSLDSSPE
jgi:membrane protein DedA with SNARE-associated domain